MRTGAMLGAAVLAGGFAIGAGRGKPDHGPDYDGGMVCYVRVADLEKSIAWYRDALGLEVLSQVDEIGWCEMKSPVEGLALGLLRDAKPDPHGGATIVFGVKDLDVARALLERKGVKFAGPTSVHEGYVKLAAFADLDGNSLTLSQSLVEAGGAPR
jgi:predicted enzyme related to lactoylglutathione lyase